MGAWCVGRSLERSNTVVAQNACKDAKGNPRHGPHTVPPITDIISLVMFDWNSSIWKMVSLIGYPVCYLSHHSTYTSHTSHTLATRPPAWSLRFGVSNAAHHAFIPSFHKAPFDALITLRRELEGDIQSTQEKPTISATRPSVVASHIDLYQGRLHQRVAADRRSKHKRASHVDALVA